MQLTDYNNNELKCAGIYLIKNKLNDHVYIGQAKNISKRLYNHLHSTINSAKSDYNAPLHVAIRKYGFDNFEINILDKCNIADLNNKEIYWISYYHSYKHDPAYNGGYNLTAGGKQNVRKVKLSKEQAAEIQNLLINTTLSKHEIAKQFCICSDFVNRINVGDSWHDNQLKYPLRPYKPDYKTHVDYPGYCILQIDKQTGVVLRKFPTRNIAGIYLGNARFTSHIGSAVSGLRSSAYGYFWKAEQMAKEDWLTLLQQYVNEDGTIKNKK